VGAGVIGLQTALFLLKAGFDVTMMAKHFPGDDDIEYSSPRAGAVCEPLNVRWLIWGAKGLSSSNGARISAVAIRDNKNGKRRPSFIGRKSGSATPARRVG